MQESCVHRRLSILAIEDWSHERFAVPMLKQAPKTTRLARSLRARETWGERLMSSWLRSQRFAHTNFAASIPSGRTFSISFVTKPSSTLRWTDHSMGFRKICQRTPPAILFWKRKASRCCDFGIRDCAGKRKLSATPSGERCTNARRIRCRIIARQQGRLRVKIKRREYLKPSPSP